MFQDLGEEVRKGRKTRSQAAGRGSGKEEIQGGEASPTGGCRQTSSMGYKKGF